MGISNSNLHHNNTYYMKSINNNGNYQCYNCHAITRSYKKETKHKLNCKNKYKIPIFLNNKFMYEL